MLFFLFSPGMSLGGLNDEWQEFEILQAGDE